MHFPKSALLLALVAGPLAPPLLAWKVKATNTPSVNRQASVHGNMTDRGVDLIKLVDPANAQVWEAARDMLWSNSGVLENDGNSHGNRLIFGERGGDMGESTPSDETPLLEKGINYNGGPFYRYWTRLFEAHSRMGALVPSSKQRYPVTQYAPEVYQYWGHLVHLAQDNCSPTHAANIRHGFNDGVEWHHWGSANLEGGIGRSIPLDEHVLARQLRDFGLLGKLDFRDYLKMHQKTVIEFAGDEGFVLDRGHKLNNSVGDTYDKRNPMRRTVDGFLERVIQDTKRWMIKVEVLQSADLDRYERYMNIFRPYDLGGNRPTESQIQDIHAYASDDDYPLDPNKLTLEEVASLTAERRRGAKLLMDLYYKRPFFNVKPINIDLLQPSPEGFWVGYSYQLIWPKIDKDEGGEWLDFNQDTTPWHPNPAYKGGAWDSHWGSYGGRWGFPGRMGYSDVGSAVTDLITFESNKIVPGDLYLMHSSDDYLPYHPFKKHFFGDYDDERDKAFVTPIDGVLEQVGNQQVDRGAMWSASLLEAISKFLPPVIQDFEVTSRNPQPGNPLPESSGYRVLASNRGAHFDVSLLFQRTDEYQVEFYAIPRQVLSREHQTDHWKRTLSIGVPGGTQLGNPTPSLQTHELWPSDLTVDQVITTPETPPVIIPGQYFNRTYDFVYSNLPMFPLRVKLVPLGGDTIPERDFNLSTPVGDGDFSPIPIPVLPLDIGATEYKYAATARFIWNGEVGKPTFLFKGPIPESDPGFESMKKYTTPSEGKTILSQNDFFILMVAYRKGAREAFANNQFKLLQNFKKKIETMAWWENQKKSIDWVTIPTSPSQTETTPMGWLGAPIPENERVQIPDELYLIRVDSKPIK